jgi:hypothetical protein
MIQKARQNRLAENGSSVRHRQTWFEEKASGGDKRDVSKLDTPRVRGDTKNYEAHLPTGDLAGWRRTTIYDGFRVRSQSKPPLLGF